MAYTTDKIRNIAVAGHGATGKTSFVEQLLVAGKAISAPATVESGKTVSDYTPEEIEKRSFDPHLPFQYCLERPQDKHPRYPGSVGLRR
jgi:hypothetical protein